MKTLLLALALLGPVQSLDVTLREWTQRHRQPWLERPMRMATDIGKPVTVLAALGGILIFDAAGGRATAAAAVLALLPTNAVVEVVKRATYRARPDGSHKRSNAAFPSSHAANAYALAAVLARRWRRLQFGFWGFAALVACSRVYLNRHWASDVIAGAAVGVACAWFAHRFLEERRRRAALRAPAPPVADAE